MVEAAFQDKGAAAGIVRIESITGKTGQTAANTARQMDTLERETREAGMAATEAGAKFGGHLQQLAQLAIGTVSVVGAYQTLKRTLSQAITEAREAEVANVRLAFAFQSNADSATKSLGPINDWADSLARLKGVDDDLIKSLATLPLTLDRTVQESERIVQVALDMETALGVDAQQAVLALTKAYDGNQTMIARMLPQIGELTKEQLAAGEATERAALIVGSATEAMANTTDGALKRAKASWMEFLEDVGSAILNSPINLPLLGLQLPSFSQGIQNAFPAPQQGTEVIGGAVELIDPNTFEPVKRFSEESDKAAAKARDLTQSMTELNRIIPEATIEMMKVADVDPRQIILTAVQGFGDVAISTDEVVASARATAESLNDLSLVMPDTVANMQRLAAVNPLAQFQPTPARLPLPSGPETVMGQFTPIDPETWKPMKDEINEAAALGASMFSAIGDGFTNAIFEGENFFDSLAQGFRSVLQDFFSEVTRMATRELFKSLLPGLGILSTTQTGTGGVQTVPDIRANPTTSSAATRWQVRNELRREMQIATARGRM